VIRGVIFDLGSTLIRFQGDWLEVMGLSLLRLAQFLDAEGFSLDQSAFMAEYRRSMERNLHQRQIDHQERTSAELLRQVLSDFGYGAVDEELVQQALEVLYSESEARWEPMPDLHPTLSGLRQAGYRLGMISNASDEANVHRLIDMAGVEGYFSPIIISAAIGRRKPDPDVFTSVLAGWEIPAGQAVMIGDKLAEDILGAQQAGMRTIWLTAEAEDASNRSLAGSIIPELIAERLADVPALIQRMAVTSPPRPTNA
jgi:HAD superfamily hydrolase (TIGR01662 family)